MLCPSFSFQLLFDGYLYISKTKRILLGDEMSKYDALWEYAKKSNVESFSLTFEEIENIAGIPIDHSFLRYKKELISYGYQVEKISQKSQTVMFKKL